MLPPLHKMNVSKWDLQYQKGEGLRWWPETELVRFLGCTYGATRTEDSRGWALDIGCGTGRHAWLLHEAGFEVNALDPVPRAIQMAKEYVLHDRRASGVYFDVAAWPNRLFNIGAFELVIDCQTIQHLTPEEHLLAYEEVFRVLKPDGRFWSMHVAAGDYDAIYGGLYPELKQWAPDDLAGMLLSVGFIPESMSSVARGERKGSIAWHIMHWRKP